MKSAIASFLRTIPLSVWMLARLLPAATAQTLLWSDDLEQGSGKWTIYSLPDAPACTSLQYISTATDPNCNHTPGGSRGLEMTAASDRVIHDVDLTAYRGASLRISRWFYSITQAGYADDLAVFVVPEPAAPNLAGLGAALLMICRRRNKPGLEAQDGVC